MGLFRTKKMTVEEKNAYAEKMWSRREKKKDREYKAAQLRAVGSALTPIGMLTGWGQGDLKRLNAERRQKAEMEKLIAAVKKSQQEPKPQIAFKYCNQCGARVPLTASFCNGCGKAIERFISR